MLELAQFPPVDELMKGTPYTLLVVEPLPLLREGVACLCSQDPFCRVVGQLSDGEQAYALLTEQAPDVAFLSLDLERLHGLEVIRKARAAGVQTKFLGVASREDRKSVLEALRGGANAYLTPQIGAQELAAAIRHVRDGGVYIAPYLNMEDIFQQARRRPIEDPLEALSSREHQVFCLLIDGVRAKEIASRLELSPKTVDTYRASLMRKLDIHDLAGLIKFAIQRNLLALERW